MTNDALKKQGMTVEKRERLTLPSGKAHAGDRATGSQRGSASANGC